jgi:hypothetical protein
LQLLTEFAAIKDPRGNFFYFYSKYSIMKKSCLTMIFAIALLFASAQPTLSWQKTYGGTNHEYIWSTIPTSDGGFAFTGYTESTDGDVPLNQGMEDLWVAKADASGTLQWSFTFGGTSDDEGCALVQATDGSYFVAGWTDSEDGDVVGHHDTYNSDLWVLHLSAGGALIKARCFGGSDDDDGCAIVFSQTGDLYVGGTTYSYDGDVSGNHGSYESDLWVIKIDTALNLIAQKCIGGSDYEEGMDLICTADNGVAITGRSYSTDGDVTGYHAGSDLLVAKLNSSFTVEWAKCYGGTETEEGNSIVQIAGGTYCVLGYTSTHNNGDVTGHHGAQGSDDFWLLHIAANGTLSSAACYGGSGDDQANGLASAADGGFVMCGLTNSTDGDVTGFHAAMFEPDFWVAKVDGSGALLWQRCCGGTGQDESFRVYEESPNVYIVTGFTYSADYDVTNWKGDADGWIIRVTGSSGINSIVEDVPLMYPNPTSSVLQLRSDQYRVVGILDIYGAPLKFDLSQNTSNIDLTALPAGIYFAEILMDGRIIRQKFLKL